MQTASAKKQSASGALTITPTFGAATIPGNTLVLLVMPGGSLGSVTTSVTDNGTSGTNVWAKIFDFADVDQAQLWACLNPAESVTSVTLTFSSAVGSGVIAIAMEEDAQYAIPSATLGTDWNEAYYKGGTNPVPATAPITTAAATVQVRSGFNNKIATPGTPNNYPFITSLAQTGGTIWSVALSGTSVTGIGTVTTESWTSGSSSIDTLTLTWQLVPAGGATGTATFGGTGTLATTAEPQLPGTATLGGTGTLAIAGQPHVAAQIIYTGSGSLAAVSAAHSGTAAFGATGTLRIDAALPGNRWLGALLPGVHHSVTA